MKSTFDKIAIFFLQARRNFSITPGPSNQVTDPSWQARIVRPDETIDDWEHFGVCDFLISVSDVANQPNRIWNHRRWNGT